MELFGKQHATHLLRGGRSGIRIWNEIRAGGEAAPSLSEVFLKGEWLAGGDFSNVCLSDSVLSGSNLSAANLSSAQLCYAGLGRANLSDAKLDRASLYLANLTGADLRRASVSGVDLSSADLSGAHLEGADLRGATLRGADLSGAVFRATRLDGACLDEARCAYTAFHDTDLSATIGLEDIVHSARSMVDVGTLRASRGRVPEAFLRGCGLADWELVAASLWNPDLSSSERIDSLYQINDAQSGAISFYSCFVSYNHRDVVFAQWIHDALQERGIRCWLDSHQVKPGQDIHDEIDRGIMLWDKLLLCCSEDSLKSWWVEEEVAKALSKEKRISNERDGESLKCIIPVDLDGFLFNKECKMKKKSFITNRLAANFRGWTEHSDSFGGEFEKLVAALRTDEGRETAPASKL